MSALRRTVLLGLAVLLGLTLLPASASAHRLWPSYLHLTALEGGQVEVFWKLPVPEGGPLALTPILPEHCEVLSVGSPVVTDNASRSRWRLDCGEQGLVGSALSVDGLAETGSDVVVQIVHTDGSTASGVLHPDAPSMTVPAPGEAVLLTAYLTIGVQHILSGPDHLLFVLGLLLVVGWRTRRLLATITAFTAAHTATLGLAAVGVLRSPQASVEAIIALSILYLAVEISSEDPAASLAARRPWLVAGGCGLVHGLGFAGALSQIGLPAENVVGALLLFNVGVELGQLVFIAAVLAVAGLASRLIPGALPRARVAVVYGIGACSAFWVIERATSILM